MVINQEDVMTQLTATLDQTQVFIISYLIISSLCEPCELMTSKQPYHSQHCSVLQKLAINKLSKRSNGLFCFLLCYILPHNNYIEHMEFGCSTLAITDPQLPLIKDSGWGQATKPSLQNPQPLHAELEIWPGASTGNK